MQASANQGMSPDMSAIGHARSRADRLSQCDESHPVCQRCAKSRKTCRWAAPVVHLENEYASGQKKRPRGPRGALALHGPSEPVPMIHPALSIDITSRAIAYYMAYHVPVHSGTLTVPDREISDFASTCIVKFGHNPTTDLAVSALALAVFSRTQNHTVAAEKATLIYHSLLRMLRANMAYVKQDHIEANLVSINILSRFEDTVHDNKSASLGTSIILTLKSFAHSDGASALLRLWRDNRRQEDGGASAIIKQTRRGSLRSALLRGTKLPVWLRDGAVFGEQGTDLEYDEVHARLLSLRHRLSMLLATETSPARKLTELSTMIEWARGEAQDIDQGLRTWVAKMPNCWRYQNYDLPAVPSLIMKDTHPASMYGFSNPVDATTWMQYFVTRMLITSTNVRILQFSRRLDPNDSAVRLEVEECVNLLNDLSDDLARCIPSCIQKSDISNISASSPSQTTATIIPKAEIKPYMFSQVVWPLTIASGIENMDPERRRWFRAELARVGRIAGYGALACAEDEQWLHL